MYNAFPKNNGMPRSEQVPETVIKHSDSELLVDVVVCCSFVCNVSARIERLGRAERDEPTTMDWSFESRSLQFSWILWHSSTAMSQAFYNRSGFPLKTHLLSLLADSWQATNASVGSLGWSDLFFTDYTSRFAILGTFHSYSFDWGMGN